MNPRKKEKLNNLAITTSNQLTLIMCSGLKTAEKLCRYDRVINQFLEDVFEMTEEKVTTAMVT
ncbi:MAG: hypothetical protein WBH77_10020 [Saccharofermentanales bacterium]